MPFGQDFCLPKEDSEIQLSASESLPIYTVSGSLQNLQKIFNWKKRKQIPQLEKSVTKLFFFIYKMGWIYEISSQDPVHRNLIQSNKIQASDKQRVNYSEVVLEYMFPV